MSRMLEVSRQEAELLYDLLLAEQTEFAIELANYIGEAFGMAPLEIVSVQ